MRQVPTFFNLPNYVDGIELNIPPTQKAETQPTHFCPFAEGNDELSVTDVAGRAFIQVITSPPSNAEKKTIGKRECGPFIPEFDTSLGLGGFP